MTYVTIDTKTLQAKKFVELIETLPYAKIIIEPNTVTKRAIEDARKRKTSKTTSMKELFTDLKK